jgi:hypothetical protein
MLSHPQYEFSGCALYDPNYNPNEQYETPVPYSVATISE